MRGFKIYIVCSILISVQLVFGQEEKSLEQLVELSLKENFDIQLARLNQESAATQNNLGMAGFLPKIGLALSDRWNNSQRNNPTSFINGKIVSSNLSPTATIDQVVFNGFSAHITKDNYDRLQDLSKQNADLVILNNIKAVYVNYYQIQAQNQLIDNQLEILSLTKKLYDYNQQKWELGLITTQELNTFYGFVLEDSLSLLGLQSTKTKLEGELAKLCNVDQITTVSVQLPKLENSLNLDSLKVQLGENPSLKSLYINELIKENEIKLAQTAIYPQLAINGGYTYSRSNIQIAGRDPVIGLTRDFYAGFTLSYNLFNGFKTKTNIDLSKINLEVQELKTEQMEQKLATDLGVYFANYQQFLEQYNLSEKLLEVTKSTLDYWQAKQKAGLITSIELRNYQKNFLLNKNSEANQWLKAYQASLEIQSLTNQIVF